MSATGRGAKRREGDYYETPAWCVEAILPYLVAEVGDGMGRKVPILDAGCGTGVIGTIVSSALRRPAVGVEVDAERAVVARGVLDVVYCDDFLTWVPRESAHFAACVLNPPYKLAREFVDRARSTTDGPVYALLRLAFLEGQSRRDWWQENPADIYVLSRRPSFTGGGTDATAYMWAAWGPGPRGRVTVV